MRARNRFWYAGLIAVLLVALRSSAQDATVVKAGEAPELVMAPAKVQEYGARAKRSVVKRSAAHVNAAATPRVRNPEIVGLTTPAATEPGEAPENIATANRWCRARGYEYMCGRGDLVRLWYEAAASGNSADPATLFADWGFDSPAVDCDFTYTLPMPNPMPSQPVVTIRRNEIAYPQDAARCKPGTNCVFTLRIPCINEKLPPTWTIETAVVKCVRGGVEVPCGQ
jgi:hypothetical protein